MECMDSGDLVVDALAQLGVQARPPVSEHDHTIDLVIEPVGTQVKVKRRALVTDDVADRLLVATPPSAWLCAAGGWRPGDRDCSQAPNRSRRRLLRLARSSRAALREPRDRRRRRAGRRSCRARARAQRQCRYGGRSLPPDDSDRWHDGTRAGADTSAGRPAQSQRCSPRSAETAWLTSSTVSKARNCSGRWPIGGLIAASISPVCPRLAMARRSCVPCAWALTTLRLRPAGRSPTPLPQLPTALRWQSVQTISSTSSSLTRQHNDERPRFLALPHRAPRPGARFVLLPYPPRAANAWTRRSARSIGRLHTPSSSHSTWRRTPGGGARSLTPGRLPERWTRVW